MNESTNCPTIRLVLGVSIALGATASACQDGRGIPCGDSVCLAGYTCRSIDNVDRCIAPDVVFDVCGNGLKEGDEQCDDGNNGPGDGCSSTCQDEVCGNAIVDSGEECDDGNVIAGDECGPTCQHEECGNDIVDPGEECDDGAAVAGDGCGPTCQYEECGNAIVDPGEECDCGDGTSLPGDLCQNEQNADDRGYCTNNCTLHCGDGVVNTTEACDQGAFVEHCTDYGFHAGQLRCNAACTGLDFDDCRHLNWNPVSTPAVRELRAIWGTGPDNIFVVGDDGLVTHLEGAQWEQTHMPLLIGTFPFDFYDVWGSGPNDVYVAGWVDEVYNGESVGGGRIYHYNGTDWTESFSADWIHPFKLWGSASDNIFAVDSYNILHFDGTDWTTVYNGSISDIWGTGKEHVFAVGRNGTIVHYSNGNWTPLASSPTTNSLTSIWGSGPDDIFAVGHAGTIVHYNGTTWTTMDSPVTGHLTSVWGTGPDNVFAVGENGQSIYYDGDNWVNLPFSEAGNIRDIWGTGPHEVFAVGSNGLMARYSGNALFPIDVPSMTSLYDIWVSASNDVFAVGDDVVMEYQGGHQMEALIDNTGVSLRGIHGFAPDHFVTTGGSQIYSSDGVGLTQISITDKPLCLHLYSSSKIWASSTENIYMLGRAYEEWEKCISKDPPICYCESYPLDAGPASYLAHIKDGALDIWTSLAMANGTDYHGVWGSDSDDVFAVGDNGIIEHFNGTEWSSMHSNTLAKLKDVWGTGPDNVFIVGHDSTLLHYDGDGWTQMDWTSAVLNFHNIAGRDQSDLYASGTGALGVNMLARFDGTRWYPITHPSLTDLSVNSLWVAPDGTTFIVGAGGKVFKLVLR